MVLKGESSKSADLLLLLLWIVIGCLLRLIQLTAKPPWTDEFATIVFSLGNDYHAIALNQVIPIDALLQPLRPNPDARVGDIVSLVLHQDNHPPLYFVLAFEWMKLMPHSGDYASLWAARSLPAFLGVLSIPAIYCLGKLAFRSALVAHLAAAMMAVSPYAVFLAQEARHYTLAILFVIASLSCLVVAARHLCQRTLFPVWLVFLWIAINNLGLAVHYFFSLTLCAEAIALLILLFLLRYGSCSTWGDTPVRTTGRQFLQRGEPAQRTALGTPASDWLPKTALPPPSFALRPLKWVVAGTLTTGLIWILTVVPSDYGNGMTEWIRQTYSNPLTLISPVFQVLATWITMLSLLPVESSYLGIVIVSGLVMLLFMLWALPLLYRGLRVSYQQPQFRLAIGLLISFISSAIALFFAITYFLGMDITRGARYSFVYFPAIILLVGVSLSACWEEPASDSSLAKFKLKKGLFPPYSSKMAAIVFLLMGIASSLTVAFNLGYQKYYRPEQLISIIKQKSSVPVLIATTHTNLVQTGEMMGIAWELQQDSLKQKTTFLLAHQAQKESSKATVTLQQALNQLPRPLDVWTVNFQALIKLNGCVIDSRSFSIVNGYNYQQYHCLD